MRLHFVQCAAALLALSVISATATVRYVDLNNTSPVSPYTDWSSAATNIQDAIDVADLGDQVLVTNGVYATGGTLVSGVTTTNRVAVTKVLTLQSVNGPEVTIIQGYRVPGTTNGASAVRCVYLANGASLIGFTLTNGATTLSDSGGGVRIQTDIHGSTSVLSNCTLSGNSADYGGGGAVGGGTFNNCILTGNWGKLYGGGAFGSSCVFNFCKLIGNSSGGYGGGAYGGTLNNCLIVSNSSGRGGGVYSGILNNCTVTGNMAVKIPGTGGGVGNLTSMRNCIVYFNIAGNAVTSNYWDSPMAYCCTAPSLGGITSITNAPLFMDQAAGDYHLQSDSPCINAGKNAYVPGTADLDGLPRISGGTVDMGAYEYQSPSSVLSYAWAQQNGLPTDGSADYADSDSDLMNNWQEWIAGTVPTNSLSVLQLLNPTNGVAGVNVTWQSVNIRGYFLECATNLGDLPPFSLLKSNIAGQVGTTSYTDTNAIGDGPIFYRVGVQQ